MDKYMKDFQNIASNNEIDQKTINYIKNRIIALDCVENTLREKIFSHHRDIETLKNEYSKIVEIYEQNIHMAISG